MKQPSLSGNGPETQVDEVALASHLADRAESLRRFFSTRMGGVLARAVSPDDLVQEVWISAFHSSNAAGNAVS